MVDLLVAAITYYIFLNNEENLFCDMDFICAYSYEFIGLLFRTLRCLDRTFDPLPKFLFYFYLFVQVPWEPSNYI